MYTDAWQAHSNNNIDKHPWIYTSVPVSHDKVGYTHRNLQNQEVIILETALERRWGLVIIRFNLMTKSKDPLTWFTSRHFSAKIQYVTLTSTWKVLQQCFLNNSGFVHQLQIGHTVPTLLFKCLEFFWLHFYGVLVTVLLFIEVLSNINLQHVLTIGLGLGFG